MMRKLIISFAIMISVINSYAQYPNNEEGLYEDMLTPEYYNTPNGEAFRIEVNKLVNFARLLPFQHPLEDNLGNIPTYTINRNFGDVIGNSQRGSHHPAIDYYIGKSTQVNMYAAHDGVVTINRDVSRYRHYLSITTDIHDDLDNIIGKMVTIYAHIDLDLDSIDDLNLNGQYVKRGDLVSKNLYSGTKGGPHLHFEIRYYRTADTSLEDFYGGNTGDNTSPSSGNWTYGYWNPNHGYGFAHPLNQINTGNLSIDDNNLYNQIKIYPNPTDDIFTIEIKELVKNTKIKLLNFKGQLLEKYEVGTNNKIPIDLSVYPSGIYFVRVSNGIKTYNTKIIKE